MKSVVTCDLEGVIKTMNTGAVELFGYSKEELIDKKRVSLFSPGEIVLQNVGMWLGTAAKEGIYEGETIFISKSGDRINAKISITPLFGDGKDKPMTGYCGVTEVIDKEVVVPIKGSTKMIKALAITRLPFISAVVMPALIGGAYVTDYALKGDGFVFNSLFFILTIFGVIFLHLGSNVLNDYFDVKDGTDDGNAGYFTQYSGGSRAVELGLITLSGTRNLGIALVFIAFAIGLFLTWQTNITTLYIGLIGLALGYFYTARPIRLVARNGLGELAIFFAFGPLVTLGTAYVLMQQIDWNAFIVGIPAGLLTTNILLINEFPDMEGDAKTGKNHLVVTFGKKASTWIYFMILTGAFVGNLYIWRSITDSANIFMLVVAVLTYIWGLSIWMKIRKDYDSRQLVKQNINTINLSALTGLLTALALWFG